MATIKIHDLSRSLEAEDLESLGGGITIVSLFGNKTASPAGAFPPDPCTTHSSIAFD